MTNKNTPINNIFSFTQESLFGLKADKKYMRQALKQARNAALCDEVPIGAVVVDPTGRIIGRGRNRVESKHTQTAHAELHALLKATRTKKNWRLEGCWMYSTLEPCIMCIGLIVNSRMAGIVYGASSPLFGYHLDKNIDSWVYKKNGLRVVKNIFAEESKILLKDFFRKKRENRWTIKSTK